MVFSSLLHSSMVIKTMATTPTVRLSTLTAKTPNRETLLANLYSYRLAAKYCREKGEKATAWCVKAMKAQETYGRQIPATERFQSILKFQKDQAPATVAKPVLKVVAAASPSFPMTEILSARKPRLQEMCKSAGLPTAGTVLALRERLLS